MPIGAGLVRVCVSRCDGTPAPFWLGVANDKVGETHEWHSRSVKNRSEEEHQKEEGKQQNELKSKAETLRCETLFGVLAGSCQGYDYIKGLVKEEHQAMQNDMNDEKCRKVVKLVGCQLEDYDDQIEDKGL